MKKPLILGGRKAETPEIAFLPLVASRSIALPAKKVAQPVKSSTVFDLLLLEVDAYGTPYAYLCPAQLTASELVRLEASLIGSASTLCREPTDCVALPAITLWLAMNETNYCAGMALLKRTRWIMGAKGIPTTNEGHNFLMSLDVPSLPLDKTTGTDSQLVRAAVKNAGWMRVVSAAPRVKPRTLSLSNIPRT